MPLSEPMKCKADRAWLGIGYYFWAELEFAQYWGEDSKTKATGHYDIYRAYLDCGNCIDAVFDEEGYFSFRRAIERAIANFEKYELEVTLDQVNRFLADEIWGPLGITGIIYDDKPRNPRKSDRVYTKIPELYYKKRIQMVLFNLENIHNFEFHSSSRGKGS